MLNEIIDGMCEAIHEGFGDKYTIYTDVNKQGLTEPCFSIFPIQPRQKQVLGQRYFKENPMCVNFFPVQGTEDSELYKVIEKLFSILEYITCGGDLVRGSNMTANISDGVVVFNVDYNFYVRRVETVEPDMEELEMRENVNGEET